MPYKKGDLVLANTTAIKGWAIYIVEEDDGTHLKTRVQETEIGRPAVTFPRFLVRAKLKRLEDARKLCYAMNQADNEEVIARIDAANTCATAQNAAIDKWCEQ